MTAGEAVPSIRIAGIVRESIVDGPGVRFVVFSQGCPHRCSGCHNPETHDFQGGYQCSLLRIVEEIEKDPLLSGVTFSGGEPFAQPENFYRLALLLKERNLHLLAYSGYTYEELTAMARRQPFVGKLLDLLDELIDGRFVLEKRDLTLSFRGSANQRRIDMKASRAAGHAVLREEG